MTEVKHWIGVGNVDKLIEKLEKYKDEFFSAGTQKHEASKNELKEMGIIFGCVNSEDDYCLSVSGAIAVLKALKRYNEQLEVQNE